MSIMQHETLLTTNQKIEILKIASALNSSMSLSPTFNDLKTTISNYKKLVDTISLAPTQATA